jgi:hypothetical protein
MHLPGRLAPEFGILRIHGVSSGALVIGRNPSISALTLQKTDIFEIGKSMYLVPIAWLYVTVLMAVAEATSSNGSVLGALITLVFYGILPVMLIVYLMRTPARRRARLAREAASAEPDAGSHAAAAPEGDSVAPVREKP